MLYVRQSSPYQVIHNLEGQKLKYAMEERLHQLGWHEIEVVDEDLGRSAAGVVTRAGFERMVAEVAWGKWELSRLAKFPALLATAVSGSCWWRSAAWSILARCVAEVERDGIEGCFQTLRSPPQDLHFAHRGDFQRKHVDERRQ